jgi:hypothetical protein
MKSSMTKNPKTELLGEETRDGRGRRGARSRWDRLGKLRAELDNGARNKLACRTERGY